MERKNGLKVYPASGGEYGPDESHPSGLAGYGTQDLVFRQETGVLPAWPEAGLGEVAYSYVLHELGAKRTFYNDAGDPVATVDGFEARTDWVWDEEVPHRLIGLIDADGVRTGLDWTTEPGTILVQRGVNLPGADPDAVWRVELDGGRVSAVLDPAGGRVGLTYTDAGLLETVVGVSGGTTEVSWKAGDDAVPRVDTVRTVDEQGAELSARTWTPAEGSTPSSGWPTYQGGEGEVFWSADPSFTYQTVLSDGATKVVSEYNSLHVLTDRKILATTNTGEQELQHQAHTYPGTQDGGLPDPADLPGNWSRPAETAVTYTDTQGASRTSREQFGFDPTGRPTSWTAEDGTVTTTEYDQTTPGDALLPVGMPITETVTAPDGQVQITRHTLNKDHTAVIATEVSTISPATGGEEIVTARSEFEVRDDGIVIEERRYPGGNPAATPVITRWDDTLDLAAGTRTLTETAAADTPAEATVTQVVDLRHGGSIADTDAVGNTTRKDYDTLGRPVSETDQLGREKLVTYETAQLDGRNATTVTGPDRVARTEVKDPLGRTSQITDNIDHGKAQDHYTRVVETREYPNPGTVRVTDAWGATTETRQDVHGRPVHTISPTGLVQLTIHDDVNNTVTTGLTPTGNLTDALTTTTKTRDSTGRIVEMAGTRTDGQAVPSIRTDYDGLGRVTATTNGMLDTRINLDEIGNPVTTTNAPTPEWAPEESAGRTDEITATRRFDGFGSSLEKTMSGDGTSRSGGARILDDRDRADVETDQLGRDTMYTYTVDGLPTEVVAGSGKVTRSEYHPVTRAVTSTTTSSPVGEDVRMAYDYEPVTDRLIGVYDPEHRAETEIRYTHDAHGNVLTVTYPDGKRIVHEYDEHGRKIATTDIADNRTALTYNQAGQLTETVQRNTNADVLARVGYHYDDFGRVSRLDRANGTATEYTFTATSQIASERTVKDGQMLTERTYTYDPYGNLIERTDTVTDAGAGTAAETLTTAYEYDAHQRLTRSTEHAGADTTGAVTRDTSYTLSASGDITTETVVTGAGTADEASVTRAFEYSPLGELASITTTSLTGDQPASTEVHAQLYDSAGNLVRAADGATYTYNAANRQTSVTTLDGDTTTTTYWADGTRQGLSGEPGAGEGEARTVFYWDGSALLNETHTGNGESGTASYLTGSGRHARSTTDTAGAAGTDTVYYGTDRHSNVTELLGAEGTITERYRYSDYGTRTVEPASGDEHECAVGRLACNPFGHAGEYTNPDNTQYLSIRTYDSDQMRFTSMDTVALHNLYAFGALNPIMNVDPSGNNAQGDHTIEWTSIGMAVGGALLTALSALIFPPALSMVGVYVVGVTFGSFSSMLSAWRLNTPELTKEVSEAVEAVEILTGALGLAFGIFAASNAAAGVAGKAAEKAASKGAAQGMTKAASQGAAPTVVEAQETTVTLPKWAKHARHYMAQRSNLQDRVFQMDSFASKSAPGFDLDFTPVAAIDDSAQQFYGQLSKELGGAINDLKTAYNRLPKEIEDLMIQGYKQVPYEGYAKWMADFEARAKTVDDLVATAAQNHVGHVNANRYTVSLADRTALETFDGTLEKAARIKYTMSTKQRDVLLRKPASLEQALIDDAQF